MQKIVKNSTYLTLRKIMVIFEFPTPIPFSLKQYLNICENVLYFFDYVGGWKRVGGISQSNSIVQNLKLVSFGSY